MIKILFIENGLGRGGSALSLKYLLDALDRTRYQPLLLLNRQDADSKGFDWNNIEILICPEKKSLTFDKNISIFKRHLFHASDFFIRILPSTFEIIRIIKGEKIDLVHLNNDIDSHIAGILASKITGTPFVCHLRSTRPLIRLEKLFSHLVRHFVVLSQMGRAFFIKEGIPSERIFVSCDPFKVACDSQSVAGLEWVNNTNGSTRIGVCGRLARGKGHEYFIKAANEIIRVKQDTHFFILGEEAADSSGYEAELKKQAAELGLNDRVTFLGWQKDVMSVIANLDIVVDPSYLQEGLRRTLIEAMVASKPFIATDVGPAKEIIENSGAGVLVPCRDSQGLADATIQLLKDRARMKSMGEQGRKYAIENFDMHKKAKEIESLYDSILLNHER